MSQWVIILILIRKHTWARQVTTTLFTTNMYMYLYNRKDNLKKRKISKNFGKNDAKSELKNNLFAYHIRS